MCFSKLFRERYSATPPLDKTLGVDVSHWQGYFNWQIAKAKGVKFAIIKVGGGRYGYNWNGIDTRANENYVNAKANGMLVGGYFWLNPFNNPEEQARIYLNWIKTHPLDLPPALDFEDTSFTSTALYLDFAKRWLNTVSLATGKTPIIYTAEWFMSKFNRANTTWMSKYPLWVASYNASPEPAYVPREWDNYAIWQCNDKGHYPYLYPPQASIGKGREWGSTSYGLDMDWFNGTYDELVAFCNLGQEVPPVEPPEPIAEIDIPHIKYSQRDSRWGYKKLGTSSSTIAGYGCLMTDYTMALTGFGKDTDPGKLNSDLIRVKGYANGNLLIFNAVTSIYPDIRVDWANYIDCSKVPAPLDKILSLLREGRLVIVKVDYNPATSYLDEHWVLIDGYKDGEFLITDPIDGLRHNFTERYKDPARHIYRIVCLLGPDGQTPPEPPAIPGLFQAECVVANLTKRNAPGVNGKVMGYLKKGDRVTVYEERFNWFRIDKDSEIWVSGYPAYMKKL